MNIGDDFLRAVTEIPPSLFFPSFSPHQFYLFVRIAKKSFFD